MKRLLSEIPEAAQIVAYQEEDPDPTVTAPTLTRNPSVLSFSAVQNGASPAAQSLTVTNTGPGTLTWTASSNSTWLTLNSASSASGTNLGSVSVRVNPAGLSVGTHNGLITIVGAGATNSPQTVSVSFDITAAPTPTIGMSATTLSFSAVQGGSNPANKTISLSNSGSGTLSWTATENAGWLSLTPASGTGPGTITVSVNTAGMTAGTVSTPITITASGATNTPQTVTVSLTITAASVHPAIGVTPRSLIFTAQQGGGNPIAQPLSISNTGGGTLSWSASPNTTWLAVSPASGTGNGAVTVNVTTGILPAGSYNGNITLNATGASSMTVPVTFTVTAVPTISLSPTSLTYTATQGGTSPANQTVALTNAGGALNWTVSDSASWLSVSPASGSSSSTLTATVNTTGLAAGTYNATITVNATGSSSRTIAVTLTVSTPTTSSATLTWTPNTIDSDLAGYKIYRRTASETYGAPLATVQSNMTTHVAAGLQSKTTYFFVVTAYDVVGNESSPSTPEASITIP